MSEDMCVYAAVAIIILACRLTLVFGFLYILYHFASKFW